MFPTQNVVVFANGVNGFWDVCRQPTRTFTTRTAERNRSVKQEGGIKQRIGESESEISDPRKEPSRFLSSPRLSGCEPRKSGAAGRSRNSCPATGYESARPEGSPGSGVKQRAVAGSLIFDWLPERNGVHNHSLLPE